MFDNKDKLVEHMTWSNHHQPGCAADWDQPQYYFPTYENDNLLFGLEDPDGDDKDSEDTGFCSDSSVGQPTVLPEDIPTPVRESILQQEDVRRSLVPARRTKSKTRKQWVVFLHNKFYFENIYFVQNRVKNSKEIKRLDNRHNKTQWVNKTNLTMFEIL